MSGRDGGPWQLYDDLVDGVDAGLTVSDFLLGSHWAYVRSDRLMGLGATIAGRSGPGPEPGPLRGASLRDVAALARSWDFRQAALGVAALTCFYNELDRVRDLGGLRGVDPADASHRTKKEAFWASADEVAGRKVAVVGHFPYLEQQLAPVCDLTILERAPQRGDYPDTACEYLIPDQDYLFVTGMTLVNKTLPRLLQLAGEHCRVALVGPSVPVAPVLFSYGADNLSSFCVVDPDKLDDLVRRGATLEIFSAGVMASVDAPGAAPTSAG